MSNKINLNGLLNSKNFQLEIFDNSKLDTNFILLATTNKDDQKIVVSTHASWYFAQEKYPL